MVHKQAAKLLSCSPRSSQTPTASSMVLSIQEEVFHQLVEVTNQRYRSLVVAGYGMFDDELVKNFFLNAWNHVITKQELENLVYSMPSRCAALIKSKYYSTKYWEHDTCNSFTARKRDQKILFLGPDWKQKYSKCSDHWSNLLLMWFCELLIVFSVHLWVNRVE